MKNGLAHETVSVKSVYTLNELDRSCEHAKCSAFAYNFIAFSKSQLFRRIHHECFLQCIAEKLSLT